MNKRRRKKDWKNECGSAIPIHGAEKLLEPLQKFMLPRMREHFEYTGEIKRPKIKFEREDASFFYESLTKITLGFDFLAEAAETITHEYAHYIHWGSQSRHF